MPSQSRIPRYQEECGQEFHRKGTFVQEHQSKGLSALKEVGAMQPEQKKKVFILGGVLLFVLAAADYGYQRYMFEKQLRMTKQEVKEEYKQIDGNPQTRSRIRSRQRQMAKRRMMQQVPDADVVITNPTHFAVALKYETSGMNAPKVVAKGADLIAKRIREIAQENDVPIVENPPLARALYKNVDIDREIPGDLYAAVAEVLAFVYQINQKRGAHARR